MTTLKEKVAIITGGGTGIGQATAELFCAEEARVIILGRRQEPLRETCRNTSAEYLVCDITKGQQVKEAVERVISSYQKLDILVNNAGIHPAETNLTELEEKVIDEILGINVKGTLLMSKYALKYMQKQGSGNIVNIASILGVIGAEETAAYSASKGAVIALTRQMAIENARYGIRVNSVSPSIVETDMARRYLEGNHKFRQRMVNAHPNKRIITPQEAAQTVLYLASGAYSGINGQNIVVDSGRSIYDR